MSPHSDDPEKRLERLFEEAKHWASVWGLSRLMRDVSVEFSDADESKLGQCDLRRMTITLNAVLLLQENEELLYETLCHELAHVVAAFRYGPRIQEHGPEWQEYMQRAGIHPRPVIPAEEIRTGSPAPRGRARRSGAGRSRCDDR